MSRRKTKSIPSLLFSDGKGNIIDLPGMEMSGRSGNDTVRIDTSDLIELPEGSRLFELPGRLPVGFDRKTGKRTIFRDGMAVAAFMAPAYTQLYLASYESAGVQPPLPLFAYTAVGWMDGKFYVPAVRIDPDIRQDCALFDRGLIEKNVKSWIKNNPENRLLSHLGKNCALDYCCPAAQNYFSGRWEAPLPTSPACNAACIGCISHQPKETKVPSTQERLSFVPTVQEIVEVAVPHLETAERAVVSFGQGCEGEPLLAWEVIRDAVREIRKQTGKGIVNINTNACNPSALDQICRAGLDSMRVSMNSAREPLYNSYYRPRNYSLGDVIESIRVVRGHGKWVSLNYFVFPGVTDEEPEYEALRALIRETQISMIQWRNFNIDPDWYLREAGYRPAGTAIGIGKLMKELKGEFPLLLYGYFNPSRETMSNTFSKSTEERKV